VIEVDDADSRDGLVGVAASQFLAAISENPASEDLVRDFVDHSFAHARGDGGRELERILSEVRADILNGDHLALATSASPLTLTSAGVAGCATGLSPTSIRRLVEVLTELPDELPEGDLVLELMTCAVTFPEFADSRIRKLFTVRSGSRFPIKPEDIPAVVTQWIDGFDPLDIFIELPFVQRSRRPDSVQRWMTGELPASTWNDEFDKCSDFLETVLRDFIPWILRSCRLLDDREQYQWELIAASLETGLNSRWAMSASRLVPALPRRALCVVTPEAVSQTLDAGLPGVDFALVADARSNLREAVERILSAHPEIPRLTDLEMSGLVELVAAR
jgi:hypothetical protein